MSNMRAGPLNLMLLSSPGFSHTAFAFAHESLVIRSSVAQVELPAGALITFLQKGLEYVGIEEHINEDGTVREFDGNYSLLSPFICEAIGVKEERRFRSKLNNGEAVGLATHPAISTSVSVVGTTISPSPENLIDGAVPAAAPTGVKIEEHNGSTEMEVAEPPADAAPTIR